jgi:radical SAM superfamily enzyme YgiQ (UPF0313 family)
MKISLCLYDGELIQREVFFVNNILLIHPDYRNETWVTGEDEISDRVIQDVMPLGLATVAALTPDDFNVDIWDERIRGRINAEIQFDRNYDLVGITGYTVNLTRCAELSSIFRKRGIPVAIGGAGVSGRPYAWRDHFDILFIGEAEITWPLFLAEWKTGTYKREYRQIEKPDLAKSPIPKWDSLIPYFPNYAMGCVQTTRGCPYDCEFCDVIYLYGRRPRHKSIERVIEEIKVLERLGVSRIFLSDDEFTGDPRYTKELLRSLIPLNNSFKNKLSFSTHASMNVARNETLLQLLSDAKFDLLIIGVETPNKEALKEARKYQNLRGDLIEDIHKILSYELPVLAGIIVGFDHDTADIFDTQYKFIQESFLPSVSINMLKAAVGTRLWMRLRKEGRVLDVSDRVGKGHIRSFTNIVPKRMSRIELMQGFCNLLEKVHTWESFSERLRGFVSLQEHRLFAHNLRIDSQEAKTFCATVDIEPESRKTVEKTLKYTEQRTPQLMETVKKLILNHVRHRRIVAEVISGVAQQIELESSGKIAFNKDNRPLVISDRFRKLINRIFPEIYRRANLNINEKERIPEVLREIFIDFLVRWGDDFDEIKRHHVMFLNEICDRTCAKFNAQLPDNVRPIHNSDESFKDVHIKNLRHDVLTSVEQELFSTIR